jgi:hypothetical protein
MVAEKQTDPGASAGPDAPRPPLPSLRRLAVAAAYAVGPLVGLSLVFGLTKFAFGLVGGYAISMAAASMLYMLVEVSVKQLTGTLHGPRDTAGQSAAQAKFAALLIGKFLFVGLVTFLVLKIPGIKMFGVAVGVIVAQAAVVICAAKFSKG